jgi:hypothetical protein
MGSSLLVLSLMAVPLMILVAVGYLNWHDGHWLSHRSRQLRHKVAPADGSTHPEVSRDVYLRR